MSKKKVLVIAACAVVVVGAVGVTVALRAKTQPAQPAMAGAEEPAGVPVSVQSPEVGSLNVSTEFIGRVQPDESVNVFPKVAGTVLQTYFEVGQPVKKGDLLFEIDPVDIQLEVDAAEASFAYASAGAAAQEGSALESRVLQSDTTLQTAQNGYDNAVDSLDDYVDTYDDEKDRLDDIEDQTYSAKEGVSQKLKEAKDYLQYLMGQVTPGGSSGLDQKIQAQQKAIEELTAASQQANAAYEQARQAVKDFREGKDPNLTQLKRALQGAKISLGSAEEAMRITEEMAVGETRATAEATRRQAEVGLESARRKLEYTKVYSPIDGVVELRSVEAHGLASQQSAAYVVSNKEIMVVKFNVSAGAVTSMAVGDPLSIEVGSETFKGSVLEIGTMVDSQSGLFPVKARVEGADESLLNGMSVKVTALTAKAEEAVLIPIDSIYHEDEKTYVYVLTPEGKAAKTYIETGITDDKRIEVTEGLSKESKLITTWNPNLVDGAEVVDAAAQQAAASSAAAAGPAGEGGDPAASNPDDPSSQEG